VAIRFDQKLRCHLESLIVSLSLGLFQQNRRNGLRQLLVTHPDVADNIESRAVGLEHEPILIVGSRTMLEMLRSWVIITKFEGLQYYRSYRAQLQR